MLKFILLLLQGLQVAFLWIHDWVPLGALNDVRAARAQDGVRRLAIITVVQSLPFTVLFAFSVIYFPQRPPHWLLTSLWIAYGVLLAGQLRAWWVPYLLHAEPQRARRYRLLFGNTHAFLPMRHGMVPNTAHVLLHVCTLATLGVLFVL